MPPTTTPEDRDTTKRLQTLFRQNPEFAEDYFSNPPRSDQSPRGKNDYARHQEAIAHVATLLQQEEAAAQYRAGLGEQPASSRVGTEREIRELMDSPSYGNSRHAGHAATMDRIGWLYRSLNPPKEA